MRELSTEAPRPITVRKIHVNQHITKSNRKTGESPPVFTVKTSKSNIYGFEVEVKGKRVSFTGRKP